MYSDHGPTFMLSKVRLDEEGREKEGKIELDH